MVMMNASIFALTLLGVVACGDNLAGGGADAAPVATSVTVTGTASEVSISGRTPTAGVMISTFEEDAMTPIASTTTDASGNYSLVIPTNGKALDGYLIGKLAGRKDTYLYPPRPLSADLSSAAILLLTQQNFDTAATLAQTPQNPGSGWIGVQVFDAANMPVAGVTVTSSPAGVVRYNNNGLPSKTPTSTATDGIAYIFSVPAGTVTVSASGGTGGLTYHSHPIIARADQVTTTLIQP